MNERIKQLAEQAITEKLSLEEFIEALKKEPNDFYGFRVSELQKFAELIVKETMQVVANNLPQNTYLDVADAVIEHFKE